MCPLISPASGAPVSASFALMGEWPVGSISGLPPSLATSPKKTWLALTSARIWAPGMRARTSRAGTIAIAIEGDAELTPVVAHRLLELNEIFRNGRVGVMGREIPVDDLVNQD